MRSSPYIIFGGLLIAGNLLATDIRPVDWQMDYTSPTIRYSGNRFTNAWTVYTNLPSSTTVAGVNAAIVNCPAGQMVRLSNGTFTVDARLFIGRSNIRITGGGASNTILQVTAAIGNGIIDVGSGDFPLSTVRTWSSGFSKGTSTITLSSATSVSVGKLLVLTETVPGTGLVNGAGDEGDCVDCSGAIQNVFKVFQHHTKVTSVSGTDIGIAIPLQMTNWSSGLTPQCYVETASIVTNVIIEDLQIDNSVSAFGQYGIFYQNTADTLLQRVWIKRAANRHVTSLHATQMEVVDNVFQDSKDRATHSYGFAPDNCTGFWCVNNIFEGVTGAFKPTSASYGVFAYNYVTNVQYTPDANWLQAPIGNHGSHSWGILIEGNIGPSIRMDNVHGSASHNTIFRNRFSGHETNRTDNSIALALQATNRCDVIAGNILGKTNFHTQWRMKYNAAGSSSTKAVEEYGYVDVDYRTTDGDNETFDSAIITHNQVSQTLNGGTNGGVYWASGYDGSLVLEKSYIFGYKPDWWGCTNFPSIGPDVLSMCTNDAIVFNPARWRFENGAWFTPMVDNCSNKQKYRNLNIKAR